VPPTAYQVPFPYRLRGAPAPGAPEAVTPQAAREAMLDFLVVLGARRPVLALDLVLADGRWFGRARVGGRGVKGGTAYVQLDGLAGAERGA
jgi:hypothetical protein